MVASQPERKRWSEEYSKWFDWVLEQAEIYDYGRYPVKGMGVWLPYGFQIRKRVIELIRSVLDPYGHEEVLFPLLIPETLLRKESEHIRGFEAEVYWVTHGGREELDVKLALRPTSETSISYMESFWIKSYRDLPKKYYQIVSIFRYETKATRPLIRLREVTTFKEAHTVHDSFEDADRQVGEAIELYKKIFDRLGIPYVISRRPEWDKFAGAVYTIAFDTILPDGRVLQIGTVHHLGQNFTIPFEVRIQLRDESLDYAWQTSYGISDRIVATIISIHGDDHGAVIPPEVAPIQVVIVPIPVPEKEREAHRKYVSEVEEELKKDGIRVKVDWREDVRPGRKFYEWEAKGVPIRLEIGSKELEEDTIVVVRRDTLEKKTVSRSELKNYVRSLLDKEIMDNLSRRAYEWLKARIRRVESLEEAKRILQEERGIVEVPWCGREECGLRMEEITEAGALGTPVDTREKPNAKCPVCGRPAVAWMRLAKKY